MKTGGFMEVMMSEPRQPSPAEGEEQGGGENRDRAKTHKTQNPHKSVCSVTLIRAIKISSG